MIRIFNFKKNTIKRKKETEKLTIIETKGIYKKRDFKQKETLPEENENLLFSIEKRTGDIYIQGRRIIYIPKQEIALLDLYHEIVFSEELIKAKLNYDLYQTERTKYHLHIDINRERIRGETDITDNNTRQKTYTFEEIYNYYSEQRTQHWNEYYQRKTPEKTKTLEDLIKKAKKENDEDLIIRLEKIRTKKFTEEEKKFIPSHWFLGTILSYLLNYHEASAKETMIFFITDLKVYSLEMTGYIEKNMKETKQMYIEEGIRTGLIDRIELNPTIKKQESYKTKNLVYTPAFSF